MNKIIIPFDRRDSLVVKKLKFLKDTKEFYSKNPKERRSLGKELCQYKIGNKRCAIGRYMINYTKVIEDRSVAQIIRLNKYLPRLIFNLETEFLQRIQGFHDSNISWTDKSLSEYGQLHYNELVEAIKEKRL